MLDRFIHVNSRGEVLDFLEHNIIANYNNLRDFEWTVSQDNDRITGFKRGITKKKIPFVFALKNENPNEIKDKFFEHFEYDVIMKQYGYFLINDYKYYCYTYKNVKTEYLKSSNYLKITLETISDKSFWKKETNYTIDFTKAQESYDNLTYPFTYEFTYGDAKANVINDSFAANDAIIRMYGPVVNPTLMIGENAYQVFTELYDNEYLEIDTEERTVYKYSKVGKKTNLFNYRNKEIDVFAKIPSGKLEVGTSDKMKVDIVTIEKRSEPKWTSSILT